MKPFHPLLIAVLFSVLPVTLFAQATTPATPPATQTKTPATPPVAQAKPPVTPPVVTPVAGSESDILGAEDTIGIQVGNHDELDQIATIGLDGKITLREFGQFMAAGKTRAILQNEIQVQADKTLNNAPVFVILKERHLQHFTVDGGVAAPGVYQFSPGMKVLDAISAAHGLPLKPVHYTLKLVRKDKTQVLSVPKIYLEPESEANVLLMPNDKLVFNEIEVPRQKVTVLGQVLRPSTYEIESNTTVLGLLQAAGSYTPAAALTRVTVTRNGTVIPLNLRPVYIKAVVDEPILNFRFEDGDVLSIPGVETKYQVLGQVNNPASYVFPEQAVITVLDALRTAGGQTPRANLNKAYILRTEDGKSKEIRVDFDSLNKKGLASANLRIQPDDILVIPQRKKPGPTLSDIFAPLTLFELLGFHL